MPCKVSAAELGRAAALPKLQCCAMHKGCVFWRPCMASVPFRRLAVACIHASAGFLLQAKPPSQPDITAGDLVQPVQWFLQTRWRPASRACALTSRRRPWI